MEPHPKVKHVEPPPAPGKAAWVGFKSVPTQKWPRPRPSLLGGGQPSLWRWGNTMAPSVSGLKAMFGVTAACGAVSPPTPPQTSPHTRCPALAGADPPGQVFVFLQIAAPALVAWFGLEGTSFSAMNLAQASMSVWA